jgi:hypothetical protein
MHLDSLLLPALEDEEDEKGITVPLPSSLLKMKKIQLDIKNSQSTSQKMARLKVDSQTTTNAFSLFDFNPITEHKPTSRKWSKLTTLPHIHGTRPDAKQLEDGYNIIEQDVLFDPDPREPLPAENIVQQDASDVLSVPMGNSERREQGVSSRHQPMNIGSVTIEFNLFPAPELPEFASKPPPSGSESRSHVNPPGIGMMPMPPSTSNIASAGRKMPHISRNQGPERFSTINIGTALQGGLGGDSRNPTCLEKRMSDLHKAVLIDNWIKILESTKEGRKDGGAPISKPAGVYTHQHVGNIAAANIVATKFGNVYPGNAPTKHLNQRQGTMASVDLAKFFDIPRAILRDLDRQKQLSSCCYNNVQSRPQPSIHQELGPGIGTSQRPDKRPPIVVIDESQTPWRGQYHKSISYQRHPPRWNPSDQGLTDLLAIQKLDTGVPIGSQDVGFTSHDLKSHDTSRGEVAEQERHPTLHLHDLDQSGLQAMEYHDKRQLKIKVNVPRDMGDSVSIRHLPKLSPRVENPRLKPGFLGMGKNAVYNSGINQHVDNLLLHLPTHGPPQHKHHGGTQQHRVRKMRQNPLLVQREAPTNAFPELSIVGSCVLDTSQLAWTEEAKALIVRMLESSGMHNVTISKRGGGGVNTLAVQQYCRLFPLIGKVVRELVMELTASAPPLPSSHT